MSFEKLIIALESAVLLIGPDERIVFANPAAEVLLGTSAAGLKRGTIGALIGPEGPIIDAIRRARENSASVTEYDVDFLQARWTPRAVDIQAVPLGASGEVLLQLHERTIALQIDRQLIHRGAARSIAAMSAVLAHEIKNPLAGIRGAAQLIMRNAMPEDRALLELIRDEVDRVKTLVERMESFGASKFHKPEPVNVHEVLDKARRIVETGMSRPCRFEETFDPSLPQTAGDAGQLQQVFVNLIRNAADAIEENGRKDGVIHLATAYRAGVRFLAPGSTNPVSLPLEISVRDNGGGILASEMGAIFEPFYTTRVKGTGLGLALVAKIVGEHNGTIDCSSEGGRTSFRVLLPALKM